ncbi:hypothetical protein PF001_g17916 [Phytophthora fragariae]|uniref:Uncharacterized protein n=1 Tax=Phytophthora fragariae TaxID=53985 RepID=A0A6A4CUD1_9STRA|nr:hypothetical protein PF001_g17916 [Phytophthora fragariae]
MTLSELKLSQLSKSNWHENADAGDRLLHTARSPARCRRRDRRESSATLDSLARCDANTLAIARMRGPSKSMESDTGSVMSIATTRTLSSGIAIAERPRKRRRRRIQSASAHHLRKPRTT